MTNSLKALSYEREIPRTTIAVQNTGLNGYCRLTQEFSVGSSPDSPVVNTTRRQTNGLRVTAHGWCGHSAAGELDAKGDSFSLDDSRDAAKLAKPMGGRRAGRGRMRMLSEIKRIATNP